MKKVILIFNVLWLLACPGCRDDKPLRIDAQQRPKMIKHVDPVYPEEAIKQRIQGVVELEATINASGEVIDVKVLPSQNPQPLLEQAAASGVRQWKYEPYKIGGKAKAVTFIVKANFALQDEKTPLLAAGERPDKIKAENLHQYVEGEKHPKKIKSVSPKYPEEAVKKRIQGVVRIEAATNEKGDVISARVLPSENPQPLLEEAALSAVKQWKYEPFIMAGKATGVTFTVTVTFSLKKD